MTRKCRATEIGEEVRNAEEIVPRNFGELLLIQGNGKAEYEMVLKFILICNI